MRKTQKPTHGKSNTREKNKHLENRNLQKIKKTKSNQHIEKKTSERWEKTRSLQTRSTNRENKSKPWEKKQASQPSPYHLRRVRRPPGRKVTGQIHRGSASSSLSSPRRKRDPHKKVIGQVHRGSASSSSSFPRRKRDPHKKYRRTPPR